MVIEMPAGWQTVRLGEVAGRVRRRIDGDPEHVLMITSKEGFIPQSDKYGRFMAGESLKSYIRLRKGEFAYNKGNSKAYPQGCIYQLTNWAEAAVPNVYICFSVNESVLDHGFAGHLFLSGRLNPQLQSVISSTVRGNGLLNISASDFFDLVLPLPPLLEQRKIAAILSTIDDAIAATQVVIAQTRRVKEALLGELLPNPQCALTGRPSGPTVTFDTWDFALLDTVAKRGSGHTPDKTKPSYWSGDIRWISLRDLFRLDRVWVDEASVRITQQGIDNSSAVLHSPGTVIVSRDATVGRSGILTVAMAVSQHFIAWKCGPRLDSLFLYYWLQQLRPIMESIAIGSTIKTIGLPYFKRLIVPVPPLNQQLDIGQRLLTADESIWASELALNQVMNLKSALLDDLLTGRTRVTP